MFSPIKSNEDESGKVLTKSLSTTESVVKTSTNNKIPLNRNNKNDELVEYDSFIVSPTLLSISSFSPKVKPSNIILPSNNKNNNKNDNNDKDILINKMSFKKKNSIENILSPLKGKLIIIIIVVMQ